MNVEKDKVVTMHYQLNEAGNLLEDSHEAKPIVYLHGHQGIFPALEQALEGKAVGDKVSVTLEPHQTYGEYNPDAIQRVSINHVVRQGKKKEKFKPGMLIYLNSKQGPQPATVIKAGLKTLDVDTNHPYAGKTLTFDVEVVDVRDATEEEIKHQHVHGEGGHHH